MMAASSLPVITMPLELEDQEAERLLELHDELMNEL